MPRTREAITEDGICAPQPPLFMYRWGYDLEGNHIVDKVPIYLPMGESKWHPNHQP